MAYTVQLSSNFIEKLREFRQVEGKLLFEMFPINWSAIAELRVKYFEELILPEYSGFISTLYLFVSKREAGTDIRTVLGRLIVGLDTQESLDLELMHLMFLDNDIEEQPAYREFVIQKLLELDYYKDRELPLIFYGEDPRKKSVEKVS